jgi:RNA polymerase sigma-70 factor (ECF subfamily)
MRERTQTSDETELLAAIAGGDEAALRQLYLRYRPRLRHYLWHQLGGEAGLVEEALQDVFLAVWQRAGAFRGEARVGTWIYQIAHHLALGARRRRDRSSRSLTPLGDVGEDDETPGAELAARSHEASVLDRLALAEAVGALSPKHRAVLHLIAQQGFTHEEAARILGVPVGTVKSRMSHARAALLQALRAPTGEDSHVR